MPGERTIAHVNDIAFVATTLAEEQRARGADVRVVDPPKPGAHLPYPWKWLATPTRIPSTLWAARAVGSADLVHVHYATHAIVGTLSGRPYVVHCHGSDVRGVGTRTPMGRLLRATLARAALVLYATPDLQSDVRMFRDDAAYLPNPIDVQRFAPTLPPTRDFLVATRLDPVKGATAMLDVLDHLLRLRPETSATVILHGSMVDEALRRFAGRARFERPRQHSDMPALLAEHRVSLGQFGLGILSQLELEAMACGSVVALPIRHPEPQAAPAPVLGTADPVEAARDVAAALEAPDRLAGLAAAGRDWVIRYHAVSGVVDRLTFLYDQILPPDRRRLDDGRLAEPGRAPGIATSSRGHRPPPGPGR